MSTLLAGDNNYTNKLEVFKNSTTMTILTHLTCFPTLCFNLGEIISCAYFSSPQYIKDFLSFTFDDSDKPIKWLTDMSILCCWLLTRKSTVDTPLGLFKTISPIWETMGGGAVQLWIAQFLLTTPGEGEAGVCEIEFITPPPRVSATGRISQIVTPVLKTAYDFLILVLHSITIKCMCKLGEGGTTDARFVTVYFLGRKR